MDNLHHHCWHPTGIRAPASAPRDWQEFKCCYCGEKKTAENFTFAPGSHGPHLVPSDGMNIGYHIW